MIHTVAGNGEYGFSGDGDLAINVQLYGPRSIAVGSSGEVYIADAYNNRIRKIALNGLISTIAGNGKQGFSGDGGVATNAQLNRPAGIAVGPSGDVYIADSYNHRIRKISPNGFISTIAGNGKGGFSGDGEATNAQLKYPKGIAMSSNGELYIADALNHRIRKISPNGLISTIAGNGKYGFSGDGGEAINAQLCHPEGIAVGPSGEVYIADTFNYRIRKVALNGRISTIAGDGSQGFSGDDGFSGDSSLATNTQLLLPEGIAVSSNGDLYIADAVNHRILKISKNGIILTIAGNGKDGFSGDGGLATKAQLNIPHDIALSSSGEIYIADTGNHRIRKIDGLYPNGSVMGTNLKKYERDHASNGLVCFQPLLAKLAPSLYGVILSAGTLLNANEKHITQQLIDSLIYGAELGLDGLESATMVDWLFVLGMIEGREFLEVKRQLLTEFMDALTADSIPVILERLDTLKERSNAENRLLSQMTDYTLGMETFVLESSPALSTNLVIQRELAQILSKVCLTELAPITPTETKREETGGIQSLFNDSATSDIRIRLGEKVWHCHRTILSSYSLYFEGLFGSGNSFNDLKDGVYTANCADYGEGLHEMVIRYCYNLLDKSDISDSVAIPLLKCASFYGMTQLVDYCVCNINLGTSNYFELIGQLGDYPCEALCFKLVEFGFLDANSLNMTQEKLNSLPEQIKEQLSCKFMQVRK